MEEAHKCEFHHALAMTPLVFCVRSIASRQARRSPRHDLLALLVENEILARRRGVELLEAILGVRKFGRRFHPDQTAIVVAPQNVVRCG